MSEVTEVREVASDRMLTSAVKLLAKLSKLTLRTVGELKAVSNHFREPPLYNTG